MLAARRGMGAVVLALISCAFAGQPADEQIQTLVHVRRQAQASLLDVANYSCVETVE